MATWSLYDQMFASDPQLGPGGKPMTKSEYMQKEAATQAGLSAGSVVNWSLPAITGMLGRLFPASGRKVGLIDDSDKGRVTGKAPPPRRNMPPSLMGGIPQNSSLMENELARARSELRHAIMNGLTREQAMEMGVSPDDFNEVYFASPNPYGSGIGAAAGAANPENIYEIE